MSLNISTAYSTGSTIFATLQQMQDDGTLGFIWDNSAGQWAAAPSLNDTKISLTEGSAPYTGRYTGGVNGTLQTYTGDIVISIHDDVSGDEVLGTDVVHISAGNPVDIGDIAATTTSPVVIDQSRTFFMLDSAEYPVAQQRISIISGSTVTIAFDFGDVLNPGTDLASATPAVVVSQVLSGSAPTISSELVNGNRTQVHCDLSNTTTGSFKLKSTVTTTDGQTLIGLGNLQVI